MSEIRIAKTLALNIADNMKNESYNSGAWSDGEILSNRSPLKSEITIEQRLVEEVEDRRFLRTSTRPK